MHFVFSALLMLAAIFMLATSSNANTTGGTLVLWVLAFAFFTGGLVLAKKGLAAKKLKKEEPGRAG